MSEKRDSVVINFIVRAIIGISLIVLMNQFLLSEKIDIHVGVNPLTVMTTGTFGVPGVALLYGISFYYGL